MAMATIMTTKSKNDEVIDFGVSMEKSVLETIDRVRGDTARSLWLKRLAVKELERLKKAGEAASQNK